MDQIITTTAAVIGGEEQQTVNARDLWKALGSKQEFIHWVKDRLEGFSIGEDFLTNLSKSHGRPKIEYTITLDVAKHLAMLERNEVGKKIRQYFIEVEKDARRRMMNPTPEDRLHAILDANGAKWILDRLERCELLELYAPENEFGSIARSGLIRGTIRRGSNPIRGGRKIQTIILRSEHPDIFAWNILKKLTKGVLK